VKFFLYRTRNLAHFDTRYMSLKPLAILSPACNN